MNIYTFTYLWKVGTHRNSHYTFFFPQTPLRALLCTSKKKGPNCFSFHLNTKAHFEIVKKVANTFKQEYARKAMQICSELRRRGPLH